MEITNEKDLPVYATTAGAAAYKSGKEVYLDIMFLRSHFIIESNHAEDVVGFQNLQQQSARLAFAKVAAVTMSEEQARELIKTIEYQLNSLVEI